MGFEPEVEPNTVVFNVDYYFQPINVKPHGEFLSFQEVRIPPKNWKKGECARATCSRNSRRYLFETTLARSSDSYLRPPKILDEVQSYNPAVMLCS